jgi:hypothetical protein
VYFTRECALSTQVSRCSTGKILEFEKKTKKPVLSFLRSLELYLRSTVVKYKNKYFRQKKGVCIGCRIAPFLSDIYLGKVNRLLVERFKIQFPELVMRGLRFVDDYLFLLKKGVEMNVIAEWLEEFSVSLKFTREDPVNRVIQFLDLKIHVGEDNTC